MAASNPIPTEDTTAYELCIVRSFDAPRSLVFRLWSDDEHAKHWMGPRGFTTIRDGIPRAVYQAIDD